MFKIKTNLYAPRNLGPCYARPPYEIENIIADNDILTHRAVAATTGVCFDVKFFRFAVTYNNKYNDSYSSLNEVITLWIQ